MLCRLSALAPLLQTLEMWGNSLGMGTLTGCVADCVADRVADCVADRVADRVELIVWLTVCLIGFACR